MKFIIGFLIALTAFAHADTYNNYIYLFTDNYGADLVYGRRFDHFIVEVDPGILSYSDPVIRPTKIEFNDFMKYRAFTNFAYYFPLSGNWKLAPEIGAGYLYENDPGDGATHLSVVDLSPRIKVSERAGWANFEVFFGTTSAFWRKRNYYSGNIPTYLPGPFDTSSSESSQVTHGISNYQNLGEKFSARFNRFSFGVLFTQSESFTANSHNYDGTVRYNSYASRAIFNNIELFLGINF